jgi:hypothetical protein
MFQRVLIPLLGIAAVIVAWQQYGWAGVALVATALVMWILLHFNRIVNVMKKAADRPKGYVGSAVMLNAKLKPKVSLLHVIALTQSIGEQVSPQGEQPEIFRWTDGTQSSVTCEFAGGRLARWTLHRPQPGDEPATPAP